MPQRKKVSLVLLQPVKWKRRVPFFRVQQRIIDKREAARKRLLRGKKLTKEQQKLFSYVKKYKSQVAKKYNAEFLKVLKKQGYSKSEIKYAKTYSLVGKNVQISLSKIAPTTYNKSNTKGKIKGKWYTIKQIKAKQKRAVKAARLKSYMQILGVSKKKAQQIFNIMAKDKIGANQLKAIIY